MADVIKYEWVTGTGYVPVLGDPPQPVQRCVFDQIAEMEAQKPPSQRTSCWMLVCFCPKCSPHC